MTALAPKADFDLRSCDVADVPILLQKSGIMTAKRLTRFFEVLVAVCSIGSLL
jgi:hypothetical protein